MNAAMTNASELVGLNEIREAAERIAPYIFVTPIVPMTPGGVRLKAESLQAIGAFKIRGAFNAILCLNEEERRRGVVAHSSGNHAQAVAYVANRLGIKAAIVMPENAPAVKLDGTKRWGAEIHLVDFRSNARYERCADLAKEHGYIVIEPFNSRTIVAGTGTIGLELLSQAPGVEEIFVPVSGGGLISGIAAAIKQSAPGIRVIGVEPDLAADAQKSFRAGHIVGISPEEAARTIADGLRVSQIGPIPWGHIHAYVDDIVTVSEGRIREAMRRIASDARLVSEPSGAVAVAGALAGSTSPEHSVAIISGGNVDPKMYASILAE